MLDLAIMPPSTCQIAPVTQSLIISCTATIATSEAVPNRFNGMREAHETTSAELLSLKASAVRSTGTTPGATALTRIDGAYSMAMLRVNASRADLETA
jgi:hypothetical protein